MEIKENNQNIVEYKGKKYKFIEDPNVLCSDCAFCNIDDCIKVTQCLHTSRTDGKDGYFVEIKPTLILKPFNLEAAKAGKPVCTRDGIKARIICFDFKNGEYPIVAIIGNDSSETLLSYTINGEIVKGNYKSEKDLMMLTEKKEGWVNVYYNQSKDLYYFSIAFKNKKEALEQKFNGCIDTIKIQWEK